ncbi:hypothetical protein [Novosphingobium sp. Gsoil 351]|uniref:hypothetical protein n=1 Tax=Novosphingobium sp. Gsoil 351 TaxID=2675225 RepID=UPI0012B47356|nr:hypothetical protein [Novosphingobium sp. Gsoil 351]QGN53951.1 hypothetical protein GKE62_04765 [Novosphingobium sp. Gsoil 351]
MKEHEGAQSATPEELYRQAEELMQQARELVRAARSAGLKSAPVKDCDDVVEFDALPGRSPRGRAEALYVGRRIRDDMFAPGLFGEFAWDILLELFLARRDNEELSVDAVCKFAPGFRDTIRRYVSLLVEQGLIETRRDASGGRPDRIKLSQRGRTLMSTFFTSTDGQMPAAPVSSWGLRVVQSERSDNS